MLTRAQKEKEVELLQEKLQRATGIVAMSYRGLSVGQTDELRAKLREGGGGEFEYRVAKNTLLRRAVAGTQVEPFATL